LGCGMISIILAGGYAKRLWPLTMEVAKPLLPLGDRLVIDYIMEKLMRLEEVERIIISTNLRFREDFERWAEKYRGISLEIAYDKSYREEEKPGAIAALANITSGLRDDCLVIAGDNVFTDDLRGLVAEYRARGATMIGLYDVGDLELARNFGVVVLREDFKVVSMEEKPRDPRSTLISTGIYLFPRSVLTRFGEYLGEGRNPDEPGRFMKWLLEREPVYGYILSGEWYDIGTHETYRMALERLASGRERDKRGSASGFSR